MSDKVVRSVLEALANQAAPKEPADLWPRIRTRLPEKSVSPRRRPVFALAAVMVLAIAATLFAYPPARAWAQGVLHLFAHAESDTLPASDTTPANVVPGDFAQAEALSGWKVYRPSSLPQHFEFYSVDYRPQSETVVQAYGYSDPSGAMRNGHFYLGQSRHLSSESWPVGQSAQVEMVDLGDGVTGEYVTGAWDMDNGVQTWNPSPNFQHIRWQRDGYYYVFDFSVFGVETKDLATSPFYLTKEQLIELAKSVK